MSGLDYLDLILPYYLLIALPVFIIFAPITPALAGHDFNVYRMQQFDVQGTQYGSRNAPVSMEARTLAAKNVMRKCVVARWTEILQEGGLELWRRLHSLGVGALLIILPQNMSSFTSSELEVSLDLESAMLNEETDIPVYFALESPEVMDIYWEMHHGSLADSSPSAAHALMQAVVSSGYSLHTAGSGSKIINNAEIASIQGRLPAETGENVPTIAIIAHYDSFGMAPDLSFGVDSNGSGAAMLLELVRLFSHAFEDMGKRAPANILFLLSGGGKLNFQGTRRWLEDQLDGLEGGLLQEVGFTLCLDTVGGAEDSLFLHVSKPPKPGTPAHEFLTVLEDIASHLYPSVNVSIVHRKINLNAEQLLWEHQRLSLRRIPAFTLSGLQNPKDPRRQSIFDLPGRWMNTMHLARNTHLVAEALAHYLFNLSGSELLFPQGKESIKKHLEAWIGFLGSEPRSSQLLLGQSNPVVEALATSMKRYLGEVKVIYAKSDKRDPEFLLYDTTHTTMHAYVVKPAIFDLFLSAMIAAYFAAVVLVIKHFPAFFSLLQRSLSLPKLKGN